MQFEELRELGLQPVQGTVHVGLFQWDKDAAAMVEPLGDLHAQFPERCARSMLDFAATISG